MRDGKSDMKNKALCLQLAYPREWEDNWVHEVKKIIKSNSKSKTTGYFYKGELEQIHGTAEANLFIQKGKYAESEDSDGDVVYKKVSKQTQESTTMTNEASLASSTKLKDDEDKHKVLTANAELVGVWPLGFSLKGRPGPHRARG